MIVSESSYRSAVPPPALSCSMYNRYTYNFLPGSLLPRPPRLLLPDQRAHIAHTAIRQPLAPTALLVPHALDRGALHVAAATVVGAVFDEREQEEDRVSSADGVLRRGSRNGV